MIPVAVAAMAGLVALQVWKECNQQTLELVLYIFQYPVTNQETKDLIIELRKELDALLFFQVIETAHRYAGQKD